MNQKKKPAVKIKKALVSLKDIKVPKPGDPFYLATDDDLTRLLADVMTGRRPSRKVWARVADLRVHDEDAVIRYRAGLAEYPSRVAMIRAIREQEPDRAWVAYRDEDGALVIFDDYASYVVALNDKVERVRVQVLGEAAPDIEL